MFCNFKALKIRIVGVCPETIWGVVEIQNALASDDFIMAEPW